MRFLVSGFANASRGRSSARFARPSAAQDPHSSQNVLFSARTCVNLLKKIFQRLPNRKLLLAKVHNKVWR
eukprot:36372-Rhodomonas_salina.1